MLLRPTAAVLDVRFTPNFTPRSQRLEDIQATSLLLSQALAFTVEVLFLLSIRIGLAVLVLQWLVLITEEQLARWQT